jgi:UDP:flavonoid glycosyltransferase YjiC (YdhE family)
MLVAFTGTMGDAMPMLFVAQQFKAVGYRIVVSTHADIINIFNSIADVKIPIPLTSR